MSLKKILVILILISPFFWWQIINKSNFFIKQYRQIPSFVKNKISSVFENTSKIDEFRWNDVTRDNRPIFGKLFYNKSQLLVAEAINYLNNLNPRFYFQSGSGQLDSPPQIEPIAILLLPCSILGIFRLIKKNQFKILLIGLLSCFLGFITGQTNFYFLFPTAIFYLYTSAHEISFWKPKNQKIFLSILFAYTIFLFFRVIFLNHL